MNGVENYKTALNEGLTCGKLIKDCNYPKCDCHKNMDQLSLSFEQQTKVDNILSQIKDSRIMAVFEAMEVAEEVISEYKEKYPDKADQIHDAFQYMRPSKYLKNVPMKVYRIHAEEIVQRIVNEKPLEPGTDAELLIAFSEISLKIPLHAEPATAYFRLAKKHFPEIIDMDYEYESYPGSIDETYEELRNKMATPRS